MIVLKLARELAIQRTLSLSTCTELSAIRAQFKRSASASNNKNEIKRTCLFKFHQERQARMEPFAGYTMPIVYKGQSIKSEHLQTRQSASVFDVSHMMQTIIRGKDMIEFLESITVTDIKGLGINKCSLSVFTNDQGGIIDDCIIGRCENHLQVVSNAGNAELVWLWLNQIREDKFKDRDVKLERLFNQGLIALQGPKASKVLQSQLTSVQLDNFKFMSTMEAEIANVGKCTITRCGYTGEDGFEISVSPELSELLMRTLCQDELVKPAGLGARDTLRLEAGLCLHGHDISDKTTPIEANLTWVVQKRRRQTGGFPGAQKVLEQIKNGAKIKRMGLIAKQEGGPPARESSQVIDCETGKVLGTITSGNYAPMLNRNIAMAYLPSELIKLYGKDVFCQVRGKNIGYQICKMPFVNTNYYI